MGEQLRIVRDYGTKVGYTGKWLVQHRFSDAEAWQTCFISDSISEASEYIKSPPKWV